MKQFLKHTAIFVISILFFSLPQFAYAHFPKTDGTITVVLHVDPNDDPIPGETAYLYFLFAGTANKFQLDQCHCQVIVSEEGKQIFHQQLVEKKEGKPSIWGTNLPFTFPTKDVYQIILTGSPLVSNSFHSFKLSWYFRVDQNNVLGAATQAASSDTDPTFIYFAIGFLSIPLVGGSLIFLLIKKATATENLSSFDQ